jgi:hypothetical protein
MQEFKKNFAEYLVNFPHIVVISKERGEAAQISR